jgi:hypothetical protein
MARDGHGLPKVLPRPKIPDPSTPGGWPTTVTALQPFHGWPAHSAGSLPLFSTPFDTQRDAVQLWLKGDQLEEGFQCGSKKIDFELEITWKVKIKTHITI